jgi:hypothetical protein
MTGPARSRRATVSAVASEAVSSVSTGRAGARTLARPLVCRLEPAIRAEPAPDLKAGADTAAGSAPTLGPTPRASRAQAPRCRPKAPRIPRFHNPKVARRCMAGRGRAVRASGRLCTMPVAEATESREPDDVEFDDTASELADRQSSPPRYEIATYPADFTLEVLKTKWDANDLIVPPFQRGFVWSQIQASKLIESFLVGLPVPAIFLYTERSSEKSLVVDGQQRLRTIFYFFDGYFGEERDGRRTTFRLKGLSDDSPYAEKTYAELVAADEAVARRFRNSVLRAFIVRQLDPDDDTSVFHIFERLNTGGTFLHNQEVRNAVCSGSFNQLLHELNQLPNWRAVLGKPQVDTRMRDIELILRFFSLFHASDRYEKPMKDFMSRYMRRHARADEVMIDRYRQEFVGTVDAVFDRLGERPFHLYAGFNSSAFDSVFCAFARNLTAIPGDVEGRYKVLAESKDFEDLVRGGTTDVEQVRGRMAMAENALFR